MKSISTVTQVSSTSHRDAEYQVVNQLPSNFRSYKFKSIMVRGLYYIEALAVARYIGKLENEINYPQLASIYSDVIKVSAPEGVDFNIMDLELLDFTTLVSISSILTFPKFSWNPSVPCSNEDCDQIITSPPINLDEFDFYPPSVTLVDNLPKLDGVAIHPVRLRDKVERANYEAQHPDTKLLGLPIPSRILTLAEMIDGDDFEDRVNKIAFLTRTQIEQLEQMRDDLELKVKEFVRECPKCHTKVKFSVGLQRLIVYP